MGHLLSGYSLAKDDPDPSIIESDAKNIGGTWKDAIRASFEATSASFPGGEIIAHLDQKWVFNSTLSVWLYIVKLSWLLDSYELKVFVLSFVSK